MAFNAFVPKKRNWKSTDTANGAGNPAQKKIGQDHNNPPHQKSSKSLLEGKTLAPFSSRSKWGDSAHSINFNYPSQILSPPGARCIVRLCVPLRSF